MGVRLSILIPAFGYPEGVGRILSSFLGVQSNDYEILIYDDSRDDKVSHVIANYADHFKDKLHYRKNLPGLGAVRNWNALVEQAAGDYILLLHHDEYPLGVGFLQRAIALLNLLSDDVDVFAMECVLVSKGGRLVRPHLPSVITRLVVKYYPAYLFKRNVLGPTSCLIVRRSLYPRFDDRLRWLVDVDAYFRLRQLTARWHVCGDLKIGSTLGREESITATIKDELKKLDAKERIYLNQKYPEARVWLAPDRHSILNALEGAAWMAMRVVMRLYYRIMLSLIMPPSAICVSQRASEDDYK